MEVGANAIDDLNAEVEVTVNGVVDTRIAGSYPITYTASDETGNMNSVIRIINVVGDPSRQLITAIDHADLALQQCIDDDNDYLYADEVVELVYAYYGIENLADLALFGNLTHFNIFGNLLGDITEMSSLTQLTFFECGFKSVN